MIYQRLEKMISFQRSCLRAGQFPSAWGKQQSSIVLCDCLTVSRFGAGKIIQNPGDIFEKYKPIPQKWGKPYIFTFQAHDRGKFTQITLVYLTDLPRNPNRDGSHRAREPKHATQEEDPTKLSTGK